MFGDKLTSTSHHIIEIDHYACAESGASRWTVTALRRNPASYSVYVGHPISGIRVGRILEMQNAVERLFAWANAKSVQSVRCLFPMRTTHLSAEEVGDNEYEGAKALFSDTRHFTLQNRMDAVMASDAVLLNFDLRDDDGNFRVSKGIPFDYGWAYACGKPVVAVIGEGNPNMCGALLRATMVTDSLGDGVRFLNSVLPHAQRLAGKRTVAEIFDFSSAGCALSMISALAEADAAKHADGGRAIIAVIPEGRSSASWHGQVAQVADWILPDLASAEEVVSRLLG